jgi:hypothetical protein
MTRKCKMAVKSGYADLKMLIFKAVFIVLAVFVSGCATGAKRGVIMGQGVRMVRFGRSEKVKEVRLERGKASSKLVEAVSISAGGEVVREVRGAARGTSRKNLSGKKQEFKILEAKIKDKNGFKEDAQPDKSGQALLVRVVIVTNKREEVLNLSGELTEAKKEIYKDLMKIRQMVLDMK